MGEFIHVTHPDGKAQEAYLALPPAGRGPAILLLGEIYNVNAWARAVVDKYAALGFVVLSPDLFWRDEPGVHMEYNPENQQRGRQFYARLDGQQAGRDLDVLVRFLKADSRVNGKVAVVGFCLGGQLAVLAGVHSVPDALIVYYGTDLFKFFGEIEQLKVPTLFHFGAEDKIIPLEIAEEIVRKTSGREGVGVYVYENAGHGFARFGHPPHHPEADALAWSRNLELLSRL